MALTEQQRRVLQDAGGTSLSLVQWMLSVLIAPIPEAWRPGLEERLELRPDKVGVPSGLLQLVVFAVVGTLGLGAWMKVLTSSVKGIDDMEAAAMLWLNPVLPLIYILTTPTGFLSAVGALGGLVRLLSGAGSRQNTPDPSLALIDFLRRTVLDKGAGKMRERSKGTRTRDDVQHAQGEETWDLRIVSWDDHDWHRGAGVRALGAAWTLLAVTDVTDAQGRLRIAYEFRRVAGAGVLRGYNTYAPLQPPRVVGEAREREQTKAADERASIPVAPPDPKRTR